MRTIRTVRDVRATLAGAASVGLVPTMGAFTACPSWPCGASATGASTGAPCCYSVADR